MSLQIGDQVLILVPHVPGRESLIIQSGTIGIVMAFDPPNLTQVFWPGHWDHWRFEDQYANGFWYRPNEISKIWHTMPESEFDLQEMEQAQDLIRQMD